MANRRRASRGGDPFGRLSAPRGGRDKVAARSGKGAEVLFLVLLFAGLFLTAALIGYNHRSDTDWLGMAGAQAAKWVAVFTFGRWGALALPAVIFLVLMRHLSGGRLPITRWIFGSLAAGFFFGYITAFIRSWSPAFPDDFLFTGIAPHEVSRLAVGFLRRGGTMLVSLAVLLTLVVLLTDLRPSTLFLALFYRGPLAVGRTVAAAVRFLIAPSEKEISKEAAGGGAAEPEAESALARTRRHLARKPGVASRAAETASRSDRDDDGAVIAAPGVRELPPLRLLDSPPRDRPEVDVEELEDNARRLEEKLANLGISARVIKANPGPVITRYDLEPAAEVKVARIASLADDIAMALRARGVRILAPIPGEAAIGIEIPNRHSQTIYIREVIGSEQFRSAPDLLTIAIGKDTNGNIFCADLERMPHLLIAGATGSGKSVCINVIISSLLYRNDPREVRLVLMDPKKIELALYSGLAGQHLTAPPGLGEEVITSPENAVKTLQSLNIEMERRYDILAEAGVRSLEEYNRWVNDTAPTEIGEQELREKLPSLVVIIDELADLMIAAKREFEELVVRLAQMARAVGIHLVVATQRPSVDVVTGLIKANFPARIAFKVAQKVDSRTIIDANGAEALLGNGDMLFLGPGSSQPVRLHGALVTTEEIERLVEFVRGQPPCESKFTLPDPEALRVRSNAGGGEGERSGVDELFEQAAKIVVHTEQGSVSVLQRRLRVGYARAARLIDELEKAGIVGPFDGSKARQVLVTPEVLRRNYGIE